MKLRLLALFFALSMLFSLAACTQTPPTTPTGTSGETQAETDPISQPKKTDVRVFTLNGTTGFGMAKLMDDAAGGKIANENYSFEVKTDVADVLAALANGSVDIAALPTNAASTAYNRTQGGVKFLAINTLGCLFLLNTTSEKIESIASLGGKTVYAPAQNPTFILTYLCRENGLSVITSGTPKANEVLIDSASYAQPALLRDAVASGRVELAVLPEPMVTIAKSKAAAATPAVAVNIDLDLTAEWDKLPGKADTLVQGCVVVRTAFLQENPTAVANFMAAYKASIEYLNAEPAAAATLIATYKIFENANVAKVAIPKCNVRYIDGEPMKTAVKAYLEILSGINAQSIGGSLPADDFYYIPQ